MYSDEDMGFDEYYEQIQGLLTAPNEVDDLPDVDDLIDELGAELDDPDELDAMEAQAAYDDYWIDYRTGG